MSEKRKEVRYIAQKFANAILADASPYVISSDGLQALNAFLDELLFILVDTAKGLETGRIKAAVYQIFPTALGKNAIVEAELEAKSYIDMGGKDTNNQMTSQPNTSAIFNANSDESRVEQVFEQFRAKCQYYSKLGERLGSPAGNPSNNVVVPTLVAIYVTAVLEHVAEYVLQIASTVADRQDHADMITVREVYVALLEDRQIEQTFETMILKSQLQKRFRHSLIMPGTGSKPEEPQPATVKRSGSWGKQLRLGNSDKPKLDVQLPTDMEEDDIPIDPNRPQFGDWDTPPDEENKKKKKSAFEALFNSGETMKVSLTPNRLRTIEVHRKAGGLGGNTASRSSSRATSVLGGRFHNRRPSNAEKEEKKEKPVLSRKNSQAASLAESLPPTPPPSVPALPPNVGATQPGSKQQPNQWNLASDGLGLGEKDSASMFDSQLTLGGSSASIRTPPPSSGGAKSSSELAQSLGSSLSQADVPMTPTSETSSTTKKENPLKSFMGRLGRNSLQRNSTDSNSVASSPTSIRSFTINGPSGTGSASGSTNGSIYSGHSGQTSLLSTPLSTPPEQPPKPPTSPIPQNRVLSQESRANLNTMSGFPLPPDSIGAGNSSINRRGSASVPNSSSSQLASKTLVSAPQILESAPLIPRSPVHPPRSMSPEVATVNGSSASIPIPSRNASLLNVSSSPTKAASSEPSRSGLEAGLPRPLSAPRTNSFSTPTASSPPTPTPPASARSPSRSVSPRPSQTSLHTPSLHQQLKVNPHEVQPSSASGSVSSPSPLSSNNGGSGRGDVSPSASVASLIMPGKVQHMQEKLSKNAVHGFKPQEHLQNIPNRMSLEGTIRANPFYQLDRSPSGRSSVVDLSATNQSATDLSTAATLAGANLRLRSGSGRGSPPVIAAITKSDKSTPSPSSTPTSVAVAAAVAAVATTTAVTRSVSSDSETDEDKNVDGMVSPATSPEMDTLKDRLPSATTRTLTAAAVAAKQQQQQQQQQLQKQMSTPPNSGSARNTTEEEEVEKIPYVAVVPRTSNLTSNSNRHSIFIDETAQAMDALSRARHRQSMIDNGAQHLDEEDEDDEDEDDDEEEDEEVYSVTQGLAPPEKWHYSEEDDEDDEEIFQEAQEGAYPSTGEQPQQRRRKRQDSFVSAKSVFHGSSVSLVDQARQDTQDEEEEELQRATSTSTSTTTTIKDSSVSTEITTVEDMDAQIGEDEDESEDSEDLDDNDDEEGQDRRIYLQQQRAKEREARRLARAAGGSVATIGGLAPEAGSLAGTTLSAINGSATRRKTLRRGSKDRPPTPTTPVPTTQIIPLTPTDLVLIRQKLFAAGTFEASMRMLDTIFHAAMAKMVEGRERGVQTEPISDIESKLPTTATTAVATEAPHKKVEKVSVSRSTATASTTTTTEVVTEDDDDEDRVVEWLLGGV
ncbi:hypothetical protein BGX31_003606 [Mortierella sp. GBA43]|nr:hypothetical protein BGX31_003606 [Mortierella sp. GBA43]